MLQRILWYLIFFKGFLYTNSQEDLQKVVQVSTCESATNAVLVERFFNLIFTEFQRTPPSCVCVQMCFNQPTYCYPTGCLKRYEQLKKDNLQLRVQNGSRSSEEGASNKWQKEQKKMYIDGFVIKGSDGVKFKSATIGTQTDKPRRNTVPAGYAQAAENNLREENILKHINEEKELHEESLLNHMKEKSERPLLKEIRLDPFNDKFKIAYKFRKIPRVQLVYDLREQIRNKMDREAVDLINAKWWPNKHVQLNAANVKRDHDMILDSLLASQKTVPDRNYPAKFFKRDLKKLSGLDKYTNDKDSEEKIMPPIFTLDRIIADVIENNYDQPANDSETDSSNVEYTVNVTLPIDTKTVYEKKNVEKLEHIYDNLTSTIIPINVTRIETMQKDQTYKNIFNDMIAKLYTDMDRQNNSIEIIDTYSVDVLDTTAIPLTEMEHAKAFENGPSNVTTSITTEKISNPTEASTLIEISSRTEMTSLTDDNPTTEAPNFTEMPSTTEETSSNMPTTKESPNITEVKVTLQSTETPVNISGTVDFDAIENENNDTNKIELNDTMEEELN